jgi:hypothetical protein
MSLSIAAFLKDLAFDTLLFGAVKAEKSNDGEGTEHDPLEGTGFEAVDASYSDRPLATTSTPSTLPAPTSQPRSPSPSSTSVGKASMDDSDSEMATDADDGPQATRKRKRKSKSKIVYQKLASKRHRAIDRLRKKETLDPDINIAPSLRKRHVASATPISIPVFSLETKVPAKTGYVAIRDSKASKRVYTLGELVGEASRFNFNLVEWDGK